MEYETQSLSPHRPHVTACVISTTFRLYLLQDRPDDFEWQWAELVLFEEVVEVLLQHLKHQAGVAAVLEALQGTHHIVLICILVTQPCQNLHLVDQRQAERRS